jgi:hypothetical protein
MSRIATQIFGEALAFALVTGAATVALAAGDQPLTGATLEKASAAALAHVGGGTVVEAESGEEGSAYQVEVRLDDGRTVEVDLDASFKVVGQSAEDEGAGEDEGQGDKEEPNDQEEPGDQDSGKQGGLRTVPQPDVAGGDVAPSSKRVDLVMPTFSHPTAVTNPLFPVSMQHSVLMLGQVDGKPFRTEVTLLPDTRLIKWEGQTVETLVSQYVAYLDGRIHEIADDLYAQADDGSVWYFGEDVSNFDDGVIVDTEGTWHAGEEGPAAMIMPAEPKVGDVHRTENIPGLVFEEVTVKAVDQTLDGPVGPIAGGLIVEEYHLLDNSREEKTFAPGYGEFFTSDGNDVEALALAVPTDALVEPEPAAVSTLRTAAATIFDAAAAKDWASASAAVDKMSAAWKDYSSGKVPRLVAPRMTASLKALAEAVRGRKTARVRQAAIDVEQWALDLGLRYRPPVEVDLDRFGLWAAQLLVDADARDGAAAHGDVFTLDLIKKRIRHSLDAAEIVRIDTELAALQGAVGEPDFPAIAQSAGALRDILAGMQRAG